MQLTATNLSSEVASIDAINQDLPGNGLSVVVTGKS